MVLVYIIGGLVLYAAIAAAVDHWWGIDLAPIFGTGLAILFMGTIFGFAIAHPVAAVTGWDPLNVQEPVASESRESRGFCATHDCIDSFSEGEGYAVQCEDGTWSQSGGRPGACSHHGGVD